MKNCIFEYTNVIPRNSLNYNFLNLYVTISDDAINIRKNVRIKLLIFQNIVDNITERKNNLRNYWYKR